MTELDLVVEEVRRAREAYFARFNYDLEAMGEDLRQRTDAAAKAGRPVGTPADRTPDPPTSARTD